MQTFGVFCALLLVSAAYASEDESKKDRSKPRPSCLYFVDGYEFDLSSATGRVFTYTNENNTVWTWSLCGPLNGTACAPNSTMCVVDGTAAPISFGSSIAAMEQVRPEVEEEDEHDEDDDDDDDDEDSLALRYTGGDACGIEGRSAIVVLICDDEADLAVQTAVLDECKTTITVSSRFGCPEEEDDDDDEVLLLAILIPVGAVLSVASIVACICCRKRILRKRAAAFQRFSDETPSVQQMPTAPQPVQQPFRMMVPMVANQQQQFPQFQPMYPVVYQPQTQPLVFPQFPVAAAAPPRENKVPIDDEKIARELQAQFDKEANM
jgi:hypothetical protein